MDGWVSVCLIALVLACSGCNPNRFRNALGESAPLPSADQAPGPVEQEAAEDSWESRFVGWYQAKQMARKDEALLVPNKRAGIVAAGEVDNTYHIEERPGLEGDKFFWRHRYWIDGSTKWPAIGFWGDLDKSRKQLLRVTGGPELSGEFALLTVGNGIHPYDVLRFRTRARFGTFGVFGPVYVRCGGETGPLVFTADERIDDGKSPSFVAEETRIISMRFGKDPRTGEPRVKVNLGAGIVIEPKAELPAHCQSWEGSELSLSREIGGSAPDGVFYKHPAVIAEAAYFQGELSEEVEEGFRQFFTEKYRLPTPKTARGFVGALDSDPAAARVADTLSNLD